KPDIAGPLGSHFTFEDVPGTSRIIVISNIPEAYEAVEQLILQLDKQKMATKDVKQVREWMARLVTEGRLRVPRKQTSISGRCLDANGQPLSNAQVMVYCRDSGQNSVTRVAQSRTDSEGRFRLGPITPPTEEDQGHKSYFVLVPANGHGPAWGAVNLYEETIEPLELTAHNSAAVSGRVVTEDSKPVAGAQVWVRGIISAEATDEPLSAVNRFSTHVPLPGWSATTDSDGSFRIAGIPDATRIQLFVSHRDFAGSIVHVKAGSHAKIIVQPGAAITGRVLYGKTGKPAAGVVVGVQGVEHISIPAGWMATGGLAVTDEQGRYRLESLPGGKYNVYPEAEDLTVVALDSFEVKPGEVRETPDLVLIEGGFIAGRVIDEATGKPVKPGQHSDVAIYGPSRPKSGAAVEISRIREDGSFRIRVAPGSNYIYLRPREDWGRGRINLRSPWVDVAEGQTVEVEFKVRKLSAEELEKERAPWQALNSYVPQTIDELENSANRLKQLGLAIAMYANEHDDTLPDGLQQLKGYVQDQEQLRWLLENVEYLGKGKTRQPNAARIPIAYDRTLLQRDYSDYSTEVLFLDCSVRFVGAPELGNLGITRAQHPTQTKPDAAIEGRVVYGTTGKPAVGVIVQAMEAEPGSTKNPRIQTVTDEQGRYRLESLYSGQYGVWAEAENLTAVALDSFQVKAGETRESPDLVLLEGGFIVGRVIDETTGKPIKPGQSSEVIVSGPSRPRDGPREAFPIREDGSFRIRVAPGQNSVFLRPMQNRSGAEEYASLRSVSVTVDDGETVEVELRVRKLSKEEMEAQTRRQQEEPDGGGGRVVRFPDNKSLGSLHIRDDNTSWLSFKPWQPLCDAKGYVVVPPGKALLLDMTEKTNDIDFSSLAALGPQDLQALVVQRTRIDLPVVSRMNDLHWLLLAGSGTRDGDLASLIGLSKLERLDLTHTKITDIGVIHLAEVISLKDLTLSGTKITDESIPYLLELSRLERLDLRNTALTENGIKRIRKGLPNCRVQY
ncbi:MAG TPA: carboxypeptidase regulatory-like domain-containing protein, partial [Sedimentisphaerales bacterium]|nr:carboxypeptidase regulatory-like domain-containing protein [Sedimentisphaerales bacterium]